LKTTRQKKNQIKKEKSIKNKKLNSLTKTPIFTFYKKKGETTRNKEKNNNNEGRRVIR